MMEVLDFNREKTRGKTRLNSQKNWKTASTILRGGNKLKRLDKIF